MFGHLQVMSCYSFQNSTILIPDLIKEAKKQNIQALALTDKNNMFGALEFSIECLKNEIKPIFGLEASVCIQEEVYPFVLLAKDDVGYFDLMKICSDINLNEEKCIDLKALSVYKSHIFVLSASREGIVESLISKDMESEALKYLQLFKSYFQDNYAIMIQNHHLKMQEELNKRIIALAQFTQVKIVCSNEVRYLRKNDALAIDLMQASSQGTLLDINHVPLTQEKYLKNEREMEQLFSTEIINNTKEMIETCRATIPMNNRYLPSYPVPHDGKAQEYLKSLCIVGLKKRFQGKTVPKEYIERLKYELKVIHDMGFDDYFLIVWDYVRFAKVNKILVGPGRGSAAGSLAAYVLGITNIDPLHYGLLFERFLNPERISMPDIDIDFQDERRDEVVDYVVNKYGQDHACQIVTFNTYGPRVAIKDMGKVMGVPLPRLEIIAKLIPTDKKNRKTITEMYQSSASFQSMINQDPALKKIVGATSVIEFLPRNVSQHAAGVVLSKQPLRDVVPLLKGSSHMMLSQYSKDYVEKIGLLKMDFLGLKNLTIIDYICQDIYKDTGKEIKLNEIPLNDQKTINLIAKADTYGIFQLESAGMRDLLMKMKVKEFEDIVVANALYRPGPMKNIPAYLENRNHPDQIKYLIQDIEPILKPTYGIMVYQEQIMQIVQKLASFSLGKADVLRRAISKKETQLMLSIKEDFMRGCLKNGYPKKESEEIYDLIERFADYGFNRSHSVAYGYVAYQLAYLKANYPVYFYSAILSNEMSSSTTKLHCIQECKAYHVDLLPPSINCSYDRFLVENGHIRYSLLSIKNVGYNGYLAIKEERDKGKFKDLFDFVLRMDESKLTKKMFESLIDAGAFDEFQLSRNTMKNNLDTIREYGTLKKNLGIDEKPVLTVYKDNEVEKLENEKNVLGLYLTKHPIEILKEKIKGPYISLASVEEYINQNIQVVLQIQRVKNITDKKGNEMCFVDGFDETGSVSCVVFSNVYKMIGMYLKKGNICLLSGKIERKEKLSFIVNQGKLLK